LMPRFLFVGIAFRNRQQNRSENPFVAICIRGDSLFQHHLFRGVCPSVAIANCCNTLWQQFLTSWV
jgi:hypothetical protein